MALQFFDNEPTTNGNLEFAADYLKANPKEDGKVYEVTEFKITSSGNGYLLYTDKFMGFLFKNAKVTKQIIEALEYYASQPNGYAFYAQLSKKAKNGINLAIDSDEPRTWFQSKNGFTQQDIDTGENRQTENSNPFLFTVPSTPPTDSVAIALKQRNGNGGQRGTVKGSK